MGVFAAIFIFSYLLGRLTILENLIYKQDDDIHKYTFKDKMVFIFFLAIKIFIAITISIFFIPNKDIPNSLSNFSFTSGVYTYQIRVIICVIGVLLGDFVGLWKMRN